MLEKPIKITQMPDYPWQKIVIDFCEPFPSEELLLVATNEASRFSEVEIAKSTVTFRLTWGFILLLV